MDTGHDRPSQEARKPYSPPTLAVLGDLRELTLGKGGGSGDGGTGGQTRI